MQAIASLSECQKFLYHASINPKEGEHLTQEQWDFSVDLLEANLGLEGHQRAVVEHVKEGRAHYHVVWNRVDVDTLTAVRMSHNYLAHEVTARELEREFDLERVQGAHAERDGIPRPERQPKQWEMDRGRRSGIDPRKVKAEVSELWAEAENGTDFSRSLEARGYLLAKGDRRDFVIVDSHGDPHSITRRTGAKAAEVRAKLADIDRAGLPTVEQARATQQEKTEREAEDAAKAREELDYAFKMSYVKADSAEQFVEELRRRGFDLSFEKDAIVAHDNKGNTFPANAKDFGPGYKPELFGNIQEQLLHEQLQAAKRIEERNAAHKGATLYDQGDMASQQADALRHHRDQVKAQQRHAREQGGFADRKDEATQKREDRAARTEQTDAQRQRTQKEILREIFETQYGRGRNEQDREKWEHERERER